MFRLALITTICVSMTGCATMRDRPTVERIDDWFAKTKYVIEIQSTQTPQELMDGLKQAPCQDGTVDSSGTAVVGPNAYAPVSVSVRFYTDFGTYPDGSLWASMNSSSLMMHDSVMAVRAFATDTGSRVLITPVVREKNDEIKSQLEAGLLLCNWRLYVDPWRM